MPIECTAASCERAGRCSADKNSTRRRRERRHMRSSLHQPDDECPTETACQAARPACPSYSTLERCLWQKVYGTLRSRTRTLTTRK